MALLNNTRIGTMLKQISTYTKLIALGILIGQYAQPIPLVVKDNALPGAPFSVAATGLYPDGFSDEVSSEIASLVKEVQ
mgnify:FL=1